MIERKNFARTSAKPGKTQTLNFYLVNSNFYLVDVPGYGFASVSKETQKKFGIMIEDYLKTRKNLKHVFLLVDYRHKPTEDDILMYNFLKYYSLNITVVATKYDKVSKNGRIKQDKILLDVLFEENHYTQVVSLPIQSPFLKTEGDPVMVNLPSYQDMLGDKLTAFAPHTTGIPFFKGARDCSMEIIKQLFDVASLFDRTYDLSITKETFRNLVTIELLYRNCDSLSLQDVLDDIFNTSRCICLRGIENPEEFRLLQNGIGRVRSYIHSENYNLDSAIINASKAAYLSKLLEKGISEVQHFSANEISKLSDAIIKEPLPTKFNKFKKSIIEAFYYWNEIQKLM